MLVKFERRGNQKPVWVNPNQVTHLHRMGDDDQTIIYLAGQANSESQAFVKVSEAPDMVAQHLNDATD